MAVHYTWLGNGLFVMNGDLHALVTPLPWGGNSTFFVTHKAWKSINDNVKGKYRAA